MDTSGLYALMVRTEERHADVLRVFRKLLEEDRPLDPEEPHRPLRRAGCFRGGATRLR